jgi:hypothetical protein
VYPTPSGPSPFPRPRLVPASSTSQCTGVVLGRRVISYATRSGALRRFWFRPGGLASACLLHCTCTCACTLAGAVLQCGARLSFFSLAGLRVDTERE